MKTFVVLTLSLISAPALATSPLCGFVTSPLSPAAASSQLSAMQGTYHEQGFLQTKSADGRDVYARFAVKIDASSVTTGYEIYPDIFGPVASFEPHSKFTVARDRFSAPIADLDGKFLAESEDPAAPGGLTCTTFGLEKVQDVLFVSGMTRSNYFPTDLSSFRGSERLEKVK